MFHPLDTVCWVLAVSQAIPGQRISGDGNRWGSCNTTPHRGCYLHFQTPVPQVLMIRWPGPLVKDDSIHIACAAWVCARHSTRQREVKVSLDDLDTLHIGHLGLCYSKSAPYLLVRSVDLWITPQIYWTRIRIYILTRSPGDMYAL
jgi:hypothetical protein